MDRNRNGAGTGVPTGDACTELVGQAPDGHDPEGFATAAVTVAALNNTNKSGAIMRTLLLSVIPSAFTVYV